ncbi:transporter substrate-binding protein [Bacillus sp. FJAT-44742]|uniref:transporter substrate-binding protein n=1 Tax=Bacillus sp. FJAT-44742 TaxID=2014005 RepID=UPI000C23EB8A|nr:transporter substrate-binding protein [Bacillus sp. FJAT-44742]
MKKIGGLFSLTGTTSVTEKGQYQAALFALEEHNRKAITTNQLVDFVIRDIASDPDKAIIQAKELIQEGVKIFIGTYTSACRKALLALLEENDCLLIYPALYEGQETHPSVFYTGEVPNQQVYPLLRYIQKYFGSNIYLIGNDYIYPHKTNEIVKRYWNLFNGNISGEKYVPFGHSYFEDVMEEIQSKKVNAIFSTLVGESIVPFYRTFKRMGMDPKLVPIFSPTTKETEIQAIGSQYAEGHFGSGSYFQSLHSSENHSFVTNFKKQYGSNQVISSVMFNTYLGTKMVAEKLQLCETFHRTSFLNLLCEEPSSSPAGLLKVEKENHHISRPIRIGQVNQEGQFNIVWDSTKLISAAPHEKKLNDFKEELITIPWENIFTELTHDQHKGLLLLNEKEEVLYSNQTAKDKVNIHAGQMISLAYIKNQFTHLSPEIMTTRLSNHFSLVKLATLKNSTMIDHTLPSFTTFDKIKTANQQFKDQLSVAEATSNSHANVLILGETGTGKEVLAHSIHRKSSRKNGPFIAINAGAIPKELIASELFGFVDGAFTGAKKGGKMGKFELANEGTLFLDEIGEMPLDLQVSLLRVLESRSVTRIGDHLERKIDVRIVAATNSNLQEEIAYQGSFRSDLYYRLNVMNIEIPPLRKRVEDIPLLANEFLVEFYNQYPGGPSKLSEEAIDLLCAYTWPGNIRELKNVMERSFLLARNKNCSCIFTEFLPIELRRKTLPPKPSESLLLEEVERKTIEKALGVTPNISKAAELLGISRSTLYRKMKSFSIGQNTKEHTTSY